MLEFDIKEHISSFYSTSYFFFFFFFLAKLSTINTTNFWHITFSGSRLFNMILPVWESQQPTARRSFNSSSASGGVPRRASPVPWPHHSSAPSPAHKMKGPHYWPLLNVDSEIVKQLWWAAVRLVVAKSVSVDLLLSLAGWVHPLRVGDHHMSGTWRRPSGGLGRVRTSSLTGASEKMVILQNVWLLVVAVTYNQ